MVTEVLDGGRFYVQIVEDKKIASIQQQLASLNLQEAPVIGAFNPKKGDIVLAQFSADNSWNRAMVRISCLLSFNLHHFLSNQSLNFNCSITFTVCFHRLNVPISCSVDVMLSSLGLIES